MESRRAPRPRLGISGRNAGTERFERFVRKHYRARALALFTRASEAGALRHYVQVPAGRMPAFVASFGARQRIAGLFCVRHPDADHLYLRLGTQVFHIEYESPRGQAPYWTVNGGGRAARFRESGSILTERLLQLSADEFTRLRDRALALRTEARVNRGPVKLGKSDNCVNVWMRAPIGAHGASLAKIIGIHEHDYGPRVMNQILDIGNERVLGAAVYPPRGQEFRCFSRTRERL